LVAGDFEPLPLASSAAAPRPAKIGATRIAAGFAAFWLAQIPFLVILLFAFGKRKGLAAFGALDVNVWHDWFLPSKQSASPCFDLLVRASRTLALLLPRDVLTKPSGIAFPA
jgi:hypothetical protein